MTQAEAALERLYAAEEAHMAAELPDFSAVATTLYPDCLIRQPAALPYGDEWRGHTGFETPPRA